jgi:hypothetical protein
MGSRGARNFTMRRPRRVSFGLLAAVAFCGWYFRMCAFKVIVWVEWWSRMAAAAYAVGGAGKRILDRELPGARRSTQTVFFIYVAVRTGNQTVPRAASKNGRVPTPDAPPTLSRSRLSAC